MQKGNKNIDGMKSPSSVSSIASGVADIDARSIQAAFS
jgi:hypothetical protein